jgi:hypothetical protein
VEIQVPRTGRDAYSNLTPRRDLGYHIVVAIDRWNQGRLFANGSLESEFTTTTRPSTTSGLFHIGAENPMHTLKVGALGTPRALGQAKAKRAGCLLSTSEVYGDPKVHPQPESYWGHVNPVGPRGVHDEAKRYAESMADGVPPECTRSPSRSYGSSTHLGLGFTARTDGPCRT